MINLFSYRQISLVLIILPAALLGFGYYLQYSQGLDPCPLCMTPRSAFYLIIATAVMGGLLAGSRLWRKLLAVFGIGFALTGLGVAGRQLWLQSLPEDQVPACGPDFNYIIDTFPLLEARSIMFRGNGNCAEVAWSWLGLSIPGWSAIAFAAFSVLLVLQLLVKK